MKIPLAWLQLSREPIRLLVALAGIGFADILMLMQIGFQEALFESNTRVHQKLLGDFVLISPQSQVLFNLKTFPRQRLYQTLAHPSVESVAPVYIDGGIWRNPQTRRTRVLTVFGFNPSQPILDLPELNQQLDRLKLLDVVLFDAASRPEYGNIAEDFTQGKTVLTELNNRQIRVGGLVTIGSSFASDGNVVVSSQTFHYLFTKRKKNLLSIGLIRLKPNVDIETVRQELASELPEDVKVLTIQEFAELEKHYWATSTAIGFIFSIGAAMGFVVGVVIVYQVLYSEVSDHLKEYATLKAIGYTHSYLLMVVFQEALILAILGYIPGLTLSIGLYSLTKGATQLPIIMTWSRAITILILTIFMCTVSGALTMRRLKSADPADIF